MQIKNTVKMVIFDILRGNNCNNGWSDNVGPVTKFVDLDVLNIMQFKFLAYLI